MGSAAVGFTENSHTPTGALKGILMSLLNVRASISHTSKRYSGDFPRGPVAETPSSQCQGPGLNPWWGT